MVVVALFTDGSVRVSRTRNVRDLFSTWRRRHGNSFLPVVCVRRDLELRPPKNVSLQWAAEQLGRLGVEGSNLRPVMEQAGRLDRASARQLMVEWDTARGAVSGGVALGRRL